MKDPNAAVPEPSAPQSPWGADLAALLKSEKTEHARGFNAGIQAAIELLARHEQDRQRLSKKGLKRIKAQGKKTGGRVPYGYQLASDGATLLANLNEQRVIALARKLRPSCSLRVIARKLKEAGFFPRGYDPRVLESPNKFEAVQIRRMLDPSVDKESSTEPATLQSRERSPK